VIDLAFTKVTDTGLANFKECQNLTFLFLNGTRVTNAGLAHFKDCKQLTSVSLKQTNVSPTKVEEWKRALPGCRIEWDGGIIEPRVNVEPVR
jgi:hypothetical protein